MRQLPLGVRLADHATFDTFHVGPNAQVLDRLVAFVDGDFERTSSTSLVLAGPPASGKTHLLQAACARFSAGEEGATTVGTRPCGYLSLGELPRERLASALEGWGRLALVALDRADSIFGDHDAEVALMRLYNDLQAKGGRLVLAVRQPLAAQSPQLPDLASRLRAGLHASLSPLDDDAAGAALRLRAAARGLELPDETITWLLRRARRDMHSLCALLDGLDEASLVAQRRLTVPFVRDMLRVDDN
ncbi:MAG: DnaA regulatory inactivator Hda [Pseudomonadota bacterium]